MVLVVNAELPILKCRSSLQNALDELLFLRLLFGFGKVKQGELRLFSATPLMNAGLMLFCGLSLTFGLFG